MCLALSNTSIILVENGVDFTLVICKPETQQPTLTANIFAPATNSANETDQLGPKAIYLNNMFMIQILLFGARQIDAVT